MMTQRLKAKLANAQSQGLLRKRHTVQYRHQHLIVIDSKPLVNFSSNDYLGLSVHPAVKKAMAMSAKHHGVGSGASALVSGHHAIHQAFEEQCSAFLQREACLLFNSGYMANLGVLTTFAHRRSVVVADKLCHASLIDGTMLSGATLRRYHHQDLSQAASYLETPYPDRILLTESVFSMEGDLTPLKQLALIAKSHHALFVVDDAHGFGALGEQGRGACEHHQLNQNDVPCLIVPFGKAMGGMGAIVSGKKEMVEQLMQFARTYRYTTALPAAMVQAMSAALTVIKNEVWRRESLQASIDYFLAQAKKRHMPLLSKDAVPIQSILVGDNHRTACLQAMLMQKGVFVPCVRPPSVPPNRACLRISLNCWHDETHILQLLDALADGLAATKSHVD